MIEVLRGTAAFAFIAANTVFWCALVYLLSPLRVLTRGRARVAIGSAAFRMVDGWVVCARWMAARLGVARIDVDIADGAALRRDGWYLVVSNHQSWADILVLVFALNGRIPQFKFFTKRELLWVPFIGVALWLLGFPMVRRYGRERLAADPSLRERDRRIARRACAGFRERPTSVLNFLEGTRFTPAKRAAAQSPYRALLKPKVGGFATVLAQMEDRLDAVVDVTIVYPAPAAPGFWDFLCGRCRRPRLVARALPLPAESEAKPWVEALWSAKDDYLAASGGR